MSKKPRPKIRAVDHGHQVTYSDWWPAKLVFRIWSLFAAVRGITGEPNADQPPDTITLRR